MHVDVFLEYNPKFIQIKVDLSFFFKCVLNALFHIPTNTSWSTTLT